MSTASVIIPTYNHATYLPDAVNSVLAQMQPGVEMIVIDDGSTDETREIAAGFGESIHYVYQENQGLSAARNAGLEQASGDFVAFLDADDAWEPDFLASSLSALNNDERLAMTYTRFRLMDERGNRLPQTGARPLSGEAYRRELRRNGFFTPNSVVVRHHILDQVGGFDTNLTSLEDWDLWLRIAREHEVAGLEQPLALYRVYAGSMSTNAERMRANRFAVLAKHYGPADDEPATWPADKREAYGCGFRSSAYEFLLLGDHDRAWTLLAEGAAIWPAVLTEIETYHQFICGDQPRAVRGEAKMLDLRARENDIQQRLNSMLMTQNHPAFTSLKSSVLGTAYEALSVMYEQGGDWDNARRLLHQAMRTNTQLVVESKTLRRLLRLHGGDWFASSRLWSRGSIATEKT